MTEEVNIIDYIRIIKNKWKLLVCIFVVTEIVTLIIAIKIPLLYESSITILPSNVIPEKIVSIIDYLPYMDKEKLLTFLYTRGNVSQVIIAMLKSRRMAIDAIEKFNLKNLYESKSTLDAAQKLQKLINISITKEGAISITVKAKNPQLATSIANFYVSNLEKMNNELKITSLTPIITVLDPAVPINSPSSSKIKLPLLIAGVISLLVGILISFFINYLENIRLKDA